MAEPQLAMTDLSEFRARRAGAPSPDLLPAGTVTFLLTDIESSTRTWESHGPAMAQAVARHYEIVDEVVGVHGGVRPVEQGEGDSVVAVFSRATDAVAAAADAQRALIAEPWPDGAALAVRMAVHTGEAQLRDDRYYTGPSIIRCARLRALAHGGQVLISGVTADLLADGLPVGAALLPLGTHRLRDLRQPERVFQLVHPELPAGFPPLRSLDALPNNLPVHLTSFVGREPALAELGARLAEHRVVTLVGAGGSGKTRLAAQVAAEVSDWHPDGVWWVELATVTDPGNVGWTVMAALGMGDDRGLDPVGRITGCLADSRTLVVLDNCEHVLDAVAGLADRVLRACPNVTVLATSREPLGLAGEVAWRVPPLSLPGEGDSSVDGVLRSEGVRLFVERARDARPSFEVDEATAPVLTAICTRLDGLPLAIELAAARIRSLPPQRILDGLSDRFRLLTGGARTATARQKTLHASVEWSHDLLSEGERVLFRRLAAFAGGFSLEAAEAVAAAEPLKAWEILGLLSDLVDKSLVVFDGERYRLLQTIHDFATARLLLSGETDVVRDRHAAWFLQVAESASAELERALRPASLVGLAVEHDNLRVALEWSMAREDDDLALRLVVALGFFWMVHGHYTEGLAWHRRVLARVPGDSSKLRCRAVWALGHMSLNCAEVSNGFGTEELIEAIDIGRRLDDPALLARPLADMGALHNFGVPGDAEAAFTEALDCARRAGDEWALAQALWWEAFYWVFNRNRPERARPFLDELAGMAERAGNVGCLRWNDVVIGMAACLEGRLADAREAMERARQGAYECADPLLEAYAVCWFTDVQIALGDYAGAREVALRTAVRLHRLLDACREGYCEFGVARVALAEGDVDEAGRQADALAGVMRTVGLAFGIEWLCLVQGRVALERGDLTSARAAFDETSAIAESTGIAWDLVAAHDHQGLLARAEGNAAAAEDWHHRALALEVEYGFRAVAAETLEALASLATAGENWAEAARLFGAARSLRETTGKVRWALDEPARLADLDQLRAALGDEDLERCVEEGAMLSLAEAAAYASRARGERKRPRVGWEALTPTELDVVRLAAQGLTNADIGQRMFISAGTVRIHLSHIYAKVGAANRAQLAAEATARGLRSEGST